MTTHRVARTSFLVRCATAALLLIVALSAAAVSPALAQNPQQRVANKLTQYLLFNLTPGGTYDVSKNTVALTQVNASAAGSISFANNSNTGDEYLIVLNGVSIQPPSAPTALNASGDNQGCALVSWNPNPENDIIGYTIYWGTSTGNYVDSLAVSPTTSRNVCGFADGTYFFALRARNSFGLRSGLSNEAQTSITTGNPAGPTPPQNVQASEGTPGCVDVTWNANPEPDIAGYTVYWGSSSGTYVDSALVGNASHTECGFSSGTYYFMVRARNNGGEHSGPSLERPVNVIGADTTPPVLSSANPANGAQNVVLDTPITFVLSDAQAGVDENSVSVTIDGQTATVSLLGTPAQYLAVAGIPGGILPASSTVNVVVTASDLASSPNQVNESWSFQTAASGQTDTTEPAITSLIPTDGAKDVNGSSDISFTVSDTESGVDVGNLQFRVNGSQVAFLVSGNSNSANISYTPSQSFTPGSTVTVEIVACDLSTAQNCQTVNASFTVAIVPIGPVASGPGEIVPDGYWVDDPTRPLEIRNLPVGWMVRIFDTAGFQVRTFRNNQADGMTWRWDSFVNDSGRRVASALYLVRVTDGGGKVQTSGRFLVQ